MDELGLLLLFAGDFVPRGYLACNGQTVSIESNQGLWELLGTTYGGNGTSTFGVPNLPSVPAGNGASMTWLIANEGLRPENGVYGIMGQVRAVPFPVPSGSLLESTWLRCDGSHVGVNGNLGLFSVLGTMYGGDGVNTFGLPTIAPLKSSNGVLIHWLICSGGVFPQLDCNIASPSPGNQDYDFWRGSVCQVVMAPVAVARLCQFALCNGQVLPRTPDWDPLQSLLGALYGPSSPTQFSLPNVPTAANGMTSLLVTGGYYPSRQ